MDSVSRNCLNYMHTVIYECAGADIHSKNVAQVCSHIFTQMRCAVVAPMLDRAHIKAPFENVTRHFIACLLRSWEAGILCPRHRAQLLRCQSDHGPTVAMAYFVISGILFFEGVCVSYHHPGLGVCISHGLLGLGVCRFCFIRRTLWRNPGGLILNSSPPLAQTCGTFCWKVMSCWHMGHVQLKASICYLCTADEGNNLAPQYYESLIRVALAIRNGNGALVHCRNGANRSAWWVIGYVMAACLVDFDPAYNYVCRLRALVELERYGDWEKRWLIDHKNELHALFEQRNLQRQNLPGVVTHDEFCGIARTPTPAPAAKVGSKVKPKGKAKASNIGLGPRIVKVPPGGKPPAKANPTWPQATARPAPKGPPTMSPPTGPPPGPAAPTMSPPLGPPAPFLSCESAAAAAPPRPAPPPGPPAPGPAAAVPKFGPDTLHLGQRVVPQNPKAYATVMGPKNPKPTAKPDSEPTEIEAKEEEETKIPVSPMMPTAKCLPAPKQSLSLRVRRELPKPLGKPGLKPQKMPTDPSSGRSGLPLTGPPAASHTHEAEEDLSPFEEALHTVPQMTRQEALRADDANTEMKRKEQMQQSRQDDDDDVRCDSESDADSESKSISDNEIRRTLMTLPSREEENAVGPWKVIASI